MLPGSLPYLILSYLILSYTTIIIYDISHQIKIIALRHGPYGREDNTLVCVHGKGALTIKIWRRTADIESMHPISGPPPEQDVPLPVPKKTKLYVEQTQRERDHAPAMHRTFQRGNDVYSITSFDSSLDWTLTLSYLFFGFAMYPI